MNPQENLITCLIGFAALIGGSAALAQRTPPAVAPNPPALGTASSFAVLSAATQFRGAVTCTDASIVGTIGSTGFLPAVVKTRCAHTGSTIAPVSSQVQTDSNSARLSLQRNRCQKLLSGTLAGIILPPGVYCFPAAAALTGTLTLSGPANGVWIFLVNGDLTGDNFSTVMAGGQACNVWWGPSGATTMTTSNLKGNVLAGQAITLTGGSFIGRAFAKQAVTMTGVAANGCTI